MKNPSSNKMIDSRECYYSLACRSSDTCNYCYECRSSYTCHSSNYAIGCNRCNYCNYCFYSKNLRMSEWMIFCLGDGEDSFQGEGHQKNYRIFNKDVSKEVYKKAVNSRPEFSMPRAKSYKEAWREAWPKASDAFRKWVRELPNFDADLFKQITGVDYRKTILVDAIGCFVSNAGIYKEMHDLLETYPNRKVILTSADDEQFKLFDLGRMPYEVFTLKHNPEKTEPAYYQKMLEKLYLSKRDVIYFEHDPEAVKCAQSLGILTHHFDYDLEHLKNFLDKYAK